MVSVPGFILRRLYVKGSLKNAAGGFEFELKNGLGAGYSTRMWPLKVDGRELPAEKSYFTIGGKESSFSAVSQDNTFTLEINKTITIWTDRETLDPGVHTVEMAFDVPGLGTMRFDFTDELRDG